MPLLLDSHWRLADPQISQFTIPVNAPTEARNRNTSKSNTSIIGIVMKYSTNVLTVFASLAVTSVSAQLPVDVTATTAAPNTFDDSDKCPGPIGNNDKGCRCIPVEDYADLRGAILRMSDGSCKCFGETSVLNGMNLLVSARLFNMLCLFSRSSCPRKSMRLPPQSVLWTH